MEDSTIRKSCRQVWQCMARAESDILTCEYVGLCRYRVRWWPICYRRVRGYSCTACLQIVHVVEYGLNQSSYTKICVGSRSEIRSYNNYFEDRRRNWFSRQHLQYPRPQPAVQTRTMCRSFSLILVRNWVSIVKQVNAFESSSIYILMQLKFRLLINYVQVLRPQVHKFINKSSVT